MLIHSLRDRRRLAPCYIKICILPTMNQVHVLEGIRPDGLQRIIVDWKSQMGIVGVAFFHAWSGNRHVEGFQLDNISGCMLPMNRCKP